MSEIHEGFLKGKASETGGEIAVRGQPLTMAACEDACLIYQQAFFMTCF